MLNKKILKKDNYLLYIPVKKHRHWELRNDVVFLVFEHDKPAERFVHWLVKKPTVSDLELDRVGSKVWQNIDGQNTVYQIGQNIGREFGQAFDPDFQRLMRFLNYLNKKGWISFTRGPQS
ncbi:coenzyme PQQ synthesis protein D (PqqD) [Peptococcaceae bacterium CEB3]|nr:coenzyme PQQ synthesis protein D (PqqD) [Peptococcaceae bacterium CEB3]